MWKESISKKKSVITKYNPEVNKYCHNCGSIIAKLADICLNCGVMLINLEKLNPLPVISQKSFMVTLLLLFFMPSFHRFYTGHIASGLLFIKHLADLAYGGLLI